MLNPEINRGELSPQAQTALEQGVFNEAMASAADHGSWGEPRVHSVRRMPAPASRRGGRSFNEPSDSELDENWNPAYVPLSPEEIEANRRGAVLVRRALAEKKFLREVDAARESGIPLMALQRARQERAARASQDKYL